MEDFIDTLAGQRFFYEWARLVRSGANPSSLASLTLESMRSEDALKRSSYTTLTTFIDCLPWADFVKAVRHVLTQDQVAAFELFQAETFYLKYRKMVLTAISQYYQDLLAAKVPTLLDPVAGLEPLQQVEEKLIVFVRAEIGRQMRDLERAVKKAVAEQLRKQLGEDWKGTDEPEPEDE